MGHKGLRTAGRRVRTQAGHATQLGNPIAGLRPISSTPGVGASYRYAFYTSAAGEYALALDNSNPIAHHSVCHAEHYMEHHCGVPPATIPERNHHDEPSS